MPSEAASTVIAMRVKITTHGEGTVLTANLLNAPTAAHVTAARNSPSRTRLEFSHVWEETPDGPKGRWDSWSTERRVLRTLEVAQPA